MNGPVAEFSQSVQPTHDSCGGADRSAPSFICSDIFGTGGPESDGGNAPERTECPQGQRQGQMEICAGADFVWLRDMGYRSRIFQGLDAISKKLAELRPADIFLSCATAFALGVSAVHAIG